ncbi:hypothetical protein P152DRAFT_427405 [Eremomyces bilateralis CBS 781.70]|uniref:BHLH domain-containing protein n=1 Tax=Eremomyces bilateralis CBS 781.70 TaxID=1392243 RepID=A0A6G1GHD0_9PEZI|nr:uncharacterized protein P152DRAFT_427405 [Eremomyces bilateralis CBS 781.70]KAF1817507.1 hypothetical protein P152DRAFT_427405 [Eremomyces bilateralis CBS 781.70]
MDNTATSPYIKNEPDDFQFDTNHFDNSQFGRSQFQGNSNMTPSVNPSDLSMGNNFMNNHSYGSQNMFMGGAGIADDELLDLGNLNGESTQGNFVQGQNGLGQGANQNFSFNDGVSGGPVSMNSQQQMFSHTPDGAPMASPFAHDSQFSHMRTMPSQFPGSQSYDLAARTRPKMRNVDRHHSDSRSPLTPKNMNGIQLGTPESGSYGGQPIMSGQQIRTHQKSVSGTWDGTPGSGSWVDSPLPSSPHQGQMHPQISEILTSGKHASLPTKVDATGHLHTGSVPTGLQSQEAKRRRRRESHNLVERRRRDNINERIHDLSRLVPGHRLDDEKIRKHINNNGPLSPTLAASGISPPQATSLLAGGAGRRAAGNITTGLPIEEKDKGPNKGDILNGAVSWTRDLMWALHRSLQQQDQLREYVESHGLQFPLEFTEEDKRMRTELFDSVNGNSTDKFVYSRGPGSGLRVPQHTDFAGLALDGAQGSGHSGTISPQSLSPSGNAGNVNGTQEQQFWMGHGHRASGSSGRGSFTLKEEDEFGMELS